MDIDGFQFWQIWQQKKVSKHSKKKIKNYWKSCNVFFLLSQLNSIKYSNVKYCDRLPGS